MQYLSLELSTKYIGLMFWITAIIQPTLCRGEMLNTLYSLSLVNFERPINSSNEVIARRVTGCASDQEERETYEEHVAKVHDRRHKLCLSSNTAKNVRDNHNGGPRVCVPKIELTVSSLEAK